jgi:hypothetical protein
LKFPTIMRFILHALSALSEALTPLKLTGPWEILFPILLLESLVNFRGRDVFPTRNLITMRCFTLRGTFYALITLATPRHNWTGSIPSRREGGSCGYTLSRSHSCCAVRLVYTKSVPVIFEPPCILMCTWHARYFGGLLLDFCVLRLIIRMSCVALHFGYAHCTHTALAHGRVARWIIYVCKMDECMRCTLVWIHTGKQ